MKRTVHSRSGFTLIELVIVLVLIGILAAVAIPRFHNMKTAAEAASIRGTLGNVRSAISIWRANTLAFSSSGTEQWPTYAQMTATGASAEVLQSGIPDNPWAGADGASPSAAIVDAGTTGDTIGTVDTAGGEGWMYDSDTGEFWANSAQATSKAGLSEASDENEW